MRPFLISEVCRYRDPKSIYGLSTTKGHTPYLLFLHFILSGVQFASRKNDLGRAV